MNKKCADKSSEEYKREYNIVKKGEVSFITFPVFESLDWLVHGFSTRLGGISKGYFSSMNLGFERGDEKEAVTENYRRICGAIGFSMENIVFSDQIHETEVERVGKGDCQGTGDFSVKKLKGIDGLMTNEGNVVLATSYADCVPLFFADEKNHAVAASHAGWRGTIGGIGEITVKAMEREFGTKPEDLKVVIGPSICRDCYEVSEDVAERFMEIERKAVLPSSQNKPGKYQLDLWLANEAILLKAGVLKKNIHISGICTCCNSELLFSHRASRGKRGGMCGFIGISSQ